MRILLLCIHTAEKLENTEGPDKIMALLMVQQMVAFAFCAYPRSFADHERHL